MPAQLATCQDILRVLGQGSTAADRVIVSSPSHLLLDLMFPYVSYNWRLSSAVWAGWVPHTVQHPKHSRMAAGLKDCARVSLGWLKHAGFIDFPHYRSFSDMHTVLHNS